MMGIFTYLKIGILVAALALGASGAWYVQGVRLDKQKQANELLTRQLAGYKKAVQILKADAKKDAETQYEKDKIDTLAPDQFADYFEQLRQRARGGTGEDPDTSEADD
jgi:hypothetical protein